MFKKSLLAVSVLSAAAAAAVSASAYATPVLRYSIQCQGEGFGLKATQMDGAQGTMTAVVTRRPRFVIEQLEIPSTFERQGDRTVFQSNDGNYRLVIAGEGGSLTGYFTSDAQGVPSHAELTCRMLMM